MWQDNIDNIAKCLSRMVVTGHGNPILNAFEIWKQKAKKVKADGKTIYLVGNGASASMASHTAIDLAKTAKIRAQTFFDPAMMTAYANDCGYARVFSAPLFDMMKKGDILLAISTSGQSINIIRAAQMAIQRGGYVVTLSALGSENTLRKLGHLNFYVPAVSYGLAETCHAALLHHLTNVLVERD